MNDELYIDALHKKTARINVMLNCVYSKDYEKLYKLITIEYFEDYKFLKLLKKDLNNQNNI